MIRSKDFCFKTSAASSTEHCTTCNLLDKPILNMERYKGKMEGKGSQEVVREKKQRGRKDHVHMCICERGWNNEK